MCSTWGRSAQPGHAPGPTLMATLRLLSAMRSGRYDVCLVLDRSPLLTVLPALAGIPLRAGIDSAGRGFALNLRVPWTETVHESELYLRVARVLGITAQDSGLSFPPPLLINPLPVVCGRSLDRSPGGPVIVLAPGGGVNPGMALTAKRWPAAHYAALARRFVDELNATIILVGGATDAPINAGVVRIADVAALHDLTDRMNFGSLGAFLPLCQLFVGNDSAPMHLAAAVGCPVVAVFGPTNPAMYAPYTQQAIVLTPALHDGPTAPQVVGDPHDVASIPVETVWNACLHMLGHCS